MSMVEPLVLVAGAAAGGAILNTLRGYLHNTEEGYSAKKLGGSLIIAVLGGLALAQTAVIDGLSDFAIILVGLTTGFAADFAITRAKKD
tara:strand:+ start:186 stop:452 length:267 start_codon:yes stop_codon:yes gene_type:complete